ncbi:PREDICTED: transcobalamin-2 isoform X3 [Cercocebus atys]|uniref:transcobalamin-2 isoform X3 n=1 Tax=Cercocebus atys TaxID=9531 RepID=UPI0005F48E76|nr:PREDICTED: transcobalamin-2 isoform X3 [Cercocebus atys]
MRHLGAFLFLLGVLGALAEICEIPEVDSHLVEKLGQHLLPWMDRLSLEHLNPSIYVGLRLSSLQAGTKEDLYLHNLKLAYQQCLLGSAFSEDDSDCHGKPSMGQLALYLLALRANCEFVGGHKGDRLVSQLKRFLEDEKRAIDTAAMAGLAFTCLKRSNFNPGRRQRITMAIRRVQEKILKAQTPEGHFGNVYSTPLALQLLMTSSMPGAELGTACLKASVALLASLQDGAFQNALMISQLLPVLNHKTYIDLIFPDCLAPRVMLEPAAETIPQTQEVISVTLQVLSLLLPYRQSISVLAGSTVEDVLKKAHELGGFTYETQASLSGPYLTSVMGKAAGEREFWQLLRDPDTPLLQGIADYRPKDGETIELRLVSW